MHERGGASLGLDWGQRRPPDGTTSRKKEETFRAAHGKGSLYPDYDGFIRRDGSFRPPDVTSFADDLGTVWVRGVEDEDADGRPSVSWKEGVSVSTTRGGFGYVGWFYFYLPAQTSLPGSLDVRHTPSLKDEGHHSIRCRSLMRRDAYEGALDTLARAALAAAVELGKQSLHFSA